MDMDSNVLIIASRIFRFLLAILIVVAVYEILLFGMIVEPSRNIIIRFDYFVWISTALVLIAGYLNLRFCRGYSYVSTSLLTLLGLAMVLFGRVSSAIYNLFDTRFQEPLIGMTYSVASLKLLTPLIPGSFLVAIASIIHSLLDRPIVFADAKPLDSAIASIYSWLRTIFSRHISLITVITIALTAFLFRFGVEFFCGSMVIGGDTPEYIAHLLDFIANPNPFRSSYWFGGYTNLPPLLDIILYIPGKLFDPITIFKIYPAAMYTILSISIYFLALHISRNRLGALVAATISIFYFLNIFNTYDYHRQHLGIVMMILSLLFLEKRYSIPSAIFLIASSLSHQVTGAVSIILSAIWLYRLVIDRRYRECILPITSLAISIALEIWYWRAPYTPNPYIGAAPPGFVVAPLYSEAPYVIVYLFAGIGFLLPLALMAIDIYRPLYTAIALLSLLAAGISPLIAPYTSATTWYRFFIVSTPILALLAGIVIARFGRIASIITIMVIIVSGIFYAYQPMYTEKLMSMLKERSVTPPGLICTDSIKAMEILPKIASEIGYNTLIIAYPEAARWLHIGLREPRNLIWIRNIDEGYICRVLNNTDKNNIIVVSWKPLQESICNGTAIARIITEAGIHTVYNISKTSQL